MLYALSALSAGSLSWYFVERRRASEAHTDYRAATSTEDAIALRQRTEGARLRRTMAQGVAIGSTGLLALRLLRRGPTEASEGLSDCQRSELPGASRFRLQMHYDPMSLTGSVMVSFSF